MRAARNPRRAILLISDGIDHHSRYKKSELMRAALESGSQMYVISIGAPQRWAIDEVVEATGGSMSQ